MEQFIECAWCDERIPVFIDLDEGDEQTFTHECQKCEQPNSIYAVFNYTSGRYNLEVSQEISG
jgi:hypothetical protein